MGSVNKHMVVGNLGKDAEVRQAAGSSVANFSVATTETWKDKNGARQEDTQWHNIVLWGKSADALAPYLTKGKQVYVEGRSVTRKWKDREGKDRYTTEIKADRVVLLGGGGDRRAEAPRSVEPEAQPAQVGEDDIPF